MTLLSLDVSTSGDQQPRPPAQFTDASARATGRAARSAAAGEVRRATDAPALAETTLVLPDGVLVDVLA